MIDYGFVKEVNDTFENVVEKVTGLLKNQGFGILTTIDVKEKFKEKLNKDFKKYVILGACNPPYAYKAIECEENIGLFLPCNVIVYEKDDKTAVALVKPAAAMSMIDNDELKNIAAEIEGRLKIVYENI